MTTQTNPLESVRVVWSAADERFFRITAELFSPSFAQGAGVLLGTYDPEPAAPEPRPAGRSAPGQRSARPATASAR